MVALELLIILLLIVVNGVFAAAEIAVLSARKVRLQVKAGKGDRKAQQALRLVEHPNTFLATVQIGITLVGTLASAFGGARVALVLQRSFERVPWLQPYSASLALGIVVLAITYLSLVLGELAPKRLALRDPEGYTRRIAVPFLALSSLAHPLVRFLTWSSRTVVRLIAGEAQAQPAITEEEIEALLEAGAKGGALGETERRLMQSVLDLSDVQVRSIMIPRTAIVGVEAGQPLEAVLPRLIQSGFSRLPVYQGDLDHIVGILHLRDVVGVDPSALQRDVASFARPALFVAEGMSVYRLLETFRRHRTQVAIVLDEYGGTAGLVTLEDVLEEIIGELSDEHDVVAEAKIRPRGSDSWIVDGLTPIEHLKEELGVTQELTGEKEYRFETVGGLVMAHLGHIPKAGESFCSDGYRFEVLRMDRHRVARVLVTRQPIQDNGTKSCPLRVDEVREDEVYENRHV